MKVPNSREERVAFLHHVVTSDHISMLAGADLLSLAAKFATVELPYRQQYAAELTTKRIAVLASFTTHHFLNALKLFLYGQGIAPELYEGEYNGIAMELMNRNSGVYAFAPDILLLLPYHSDIKEYPSLFSGVREIDAWVKERVAHYQELWARAKQLQGCQTLHALFVLPLVQQLGYLESNYLFSRSSCLRMLNLEMIKSRPPDVGLLDMDFVASSFGKRRWFDEAAYFTSKQAFSLGALAFVCRVISRRMAAHLGRGKKCLVLDLDNTLWGGVVGDDGLSGIQLNPNDARGEAFVAFQRYVLSLKDRGVILAVCSKNEEQIAKEVFLKHPDMILKLDDIACFVANWNDKASNLKGIADALNIGLESLVFVDDNPAERDIVRRFLPAVQVVELSQDPALFVRDVEDALCFEWAQLSPEDLGRSGTYARNRQRADLQAGTVDYDAYLRALEMSAAVGVIGPLELPRFCQLINKSNQFNLRTRRYNEAAIEQMRGDRDHWVLLYVSLKDRFDNYGIISCGILHKREGCAFIDTWVMSCRVLRRGVEEVMFNQLCRQARQLGCEWLVGEYVPTPKNSLVSQLLPGFGFERAANWLEPTTGDSIVYRLDLRCADERPHLIRLEMP